MGLICVKFMFVLPGNSMCAVLCKQRSYWEKTKRWEILILLYDKAAMLIPGLLVSNNLISEVMIPRCSGDIYSWRLMRLFLRDGIANFIINRDGTSALRQSGLRVQ
jgi:hypothetical protein